MGISYTTHLGPYVECRVHKIKISESSRVCMSKTCQQHDPKYWQRDDVKYCKVCGMVVGNVEFPTEVDNVNEDDVTEELHEKFSCCVIDGTHFWVSNMVSFPRLHNVGGTTFDPHEHDELLVRVTPELIETEISDFHRHFAEEISIICKNYDGENVEVKWGLIHRAH